MCICCGLARRIFSYRNTSCHAKSLSLPTHIMPAYNASHRPEPQVTMWRNVEELHASIYVIDLRCFIIMEYGIYHTLPSQIIRCTNKGLTHPIKLSGIWESVSSLGAKREDLWWNRMYIKPCFYRWTLGLSWPKVYSWTSTDKTVLNGNTKEHGKRGNSFSSRHW